MLSFNLSTAAQVGGEYSPTAWHHSSYFGFPYQVSRDGTRFLIERPIQEAAAHPITVILNWTASLPSH